MAFYELNFAAFAAVNAFLLYRQYRWRGRRGPADEERGPDGHKAGVEHVEVADQAALGRFQRDFLAVYGLAVAADWLQGPHIYAIYKYEKQIPERVVAGLYAAGFISGGLSASFAGELADRHGRRLACLAYCALYAVTCLTMLSDRLPLLLLGRLCGGVATTLLYSVFEAWLITDWHNRGLGGGPGAPALGAVFGRMTTLSSVVAIASGVVGEAMVAQLGGRIWPFMASIACCAGAAYLMLRTWRENYGAHSAQQTSLQDVRSGVRTIVRDARILSLGIASCFFEGAMYLFVFFWSSALKSARERAAAARGGEPEELPYGLIFSCFMCAMMAGSSLFSLSTSGGGGGSSGGGGGSSGGSSTPSSPSSSSGGGGGRSPPHRRESAAAFILMCCVLLVSCCLSLAVLLLRAERALFWALCVIEACVGAYFPSMSLLKSEVVEDGVRARVYSILRLPLNVLVVVAHALDREGDAHRNHVFTALAALLILAYFVVRKNFAAE